MKRLKEKTLGEQTDKNKVRPGQNTSNIVKYLILFFLYHPICNQIEKEKQRNDSILKC